MVEVVLTTCMVVLILCAIAIAIAKKKNMNTYDNHDKIDKAIYKYKLICIQNHDWDALRHVEYKDAEDYMKTFWRFYDWGYTRILPKDKFEIIKPYIK